MMPDGSLTDSECRTELLKLARFLDENFPDEVKSSPNELPTALAIRLLQESRECNNCGRVFKHGGPFCVRCQ